MMMNKIQDFLAKVDFWYAKKFIRLDKEYTFHVDISNPTAVSVKILRRYPDVIVQYDNIRIDDDSQCLFDVNVISNPNNIDVESSRFYKFTSYVFRSILIGAINAIKNSGEYNENRNAHLVKSDSERSIHEEVVAVSEERVSNRKPRKKAVRGNKTIHPEV